MKTLNHVCVDGAAGKFDMLPALRRLQDATAVLSYTVQIWLVDWLPNHLRRRILCKEYSGDALERRLQLRIGGGLKMIRALWRMSTINRHPSVSVGSEVPHLSVLSLLDDSKAEHCDQIPLLSLGGYGSRPLVLNFGSCT